MRTRLLLPAVAVLLAACSSGPPPVINQQSLDQIQDNMSTGDVRKLLGTPSEMHDEPAPTGSGTQTTYTYRTDKAQVTIIFVNDHVQEKHGVFRP